VPFRGSSRIRTYNLEHTISFCIFFGRTLASGGGRVSQPGDDVKIAPAERSHSLKEVSVMTDRDKKS
jgi:hypothetical protein